MIMNHHIHILGLFFIITIYSDVCYAARPLNNGWVESDYIYAISDDGTTNGSSYGYKKARISMFSNATNDIIYLSPIWKNKESGLELTIDNKIILYGASSIEEIIKSCHLQENLTAIEEIDGDPIIYVMSLRGVTYNQIDSLCSKIMNSGYCDIAESNVIYLSNITDIVPSQNPLYPNQWQWYNTTNNKFDVNAKDAWLLSTGENIKVAIIDDGFELNHPDLKDNFEKGYDCTDGRDGAKNGAYKLVQDSHGTQCAGMIGATNNDIGIIGIAPNCRMIPIRRMYSMKSIDKNGNEEIISYSSSSYAIKALRKAYQVGADVISNSWSLHGVTSSTIYDAIIEEAILRGRNGLGCVIVFSTGNQGSSSINYPSNHHRTLAVGASNRYGRCASFSNYGENLDVIAPGENIYTTQIIPFNSYTISSGTSFSCPLVAGVAALMLSIAPHLRWEEVCAIIRRTAYKLPDYNFYTLTNYGMWNQEIGYGLVDAFAAVKETQKRYVQNVIFSSTASEEIMGTSIHVGTYVTDNQEKGDVILQSHSQVTLQATDFIRITDGFHAKRGSTFTAKIISGYDWLSISDVHSESPIVRKSIPHNPNYNNIELMNNNNNFQMNSDISSIRIYSLQGQLVSTLSNNNTGSTFDLPNGYYLFVTMMTNGTIITKKVYL